MIETRLFSAANKPSFEQKAKIIDFLFKNLEAYGDPQFAIEKAIDYALKEIPSFGGFIVVSELNNQITGAVVVNQTGMKDYIPENILVYIATSREHRGQGIGKAMMQRTMELAKGSIALHVEPDNPARFLYEKMGFGSKYLEMRYTEPLK